APTRIAVPPRNITAKKGETVTFRCPVTFDPALASRGHLEWLWDGKVLSETPDSNR
ncbi:NGCA protein, partial [Rhinopomastus cyanomelas]|nr:NGCA protein [Rhinopomastus cyanomelas]